MIDLGNERTVRGFRCLARQDGGWNGAIAECEFAIGNSATEFGKPNATAKLRKVRSSQEVTCEPATGRYVRLRILSEVNGGPWASIAELGIIGN